MIAKETIEKILETARVDEVVGDFVQLKKRGVSLIGLCPFHNEKTPSFNVSVTKGIYKCFGCGKGGDSLQFVMDHEKYTYPEARRNGTITGTINCRHPSRKPVCHHSLGRKIFPEQHVEYRGRQDHRFELF
jgi:DNA primase catalytic core